MIKKIITLIISFLFVISGTMLMFNKLQVDLGFDLKGGTELLIKVDSKDYIEEKLKTSLVKIKPMSSSAQIQNKQLVFTSDEPEGKIKNYLHNINLDYTKQNDTYYAELNNIKEIEDNLISSSIQTIRNRIDPLGTKDISVTQSGKEHILISIPGKADLKYIEHVLSTKAKLSFHFVVDENDENARKVPYYNNPNKYQYISNFSYITGENLIDANPTVSGSYDIVIGIKFDMSGAKTFSFMTKKAGKKIAIVLDDKVLTDPTVQAHITSGQATITGLKSIEEASETALFLKSGSLKGSFSIVEKSQIGPTIGEEAIKNAKPATIISIIAVGALMIGCYGLIMGIVSIMTIIMTLIIILTLMAIFQIKITLFGIGGIIATIGMCVDANVLIFENIIEEKVRKNPNYIMKGFNNAWITIFDSNLTTIIAALGLLIFGSSMLIGFAITLIIGIFGSIFSAVYMAEYALNMLSKLVAGEGLEPPTSRL